MSNKVQKPVTVKFLFDSKESADRFTNAIWSLKAQGLRSIEVPKEVTP